MAARPGKGGAGSAAANEELSKAIAAHGAVVGREQVARQSYADQLAALIRQVHP